MGEQNWRPIDDLLRYDPGEDEDEERRSRARIYGEPPVAEGIDCPVTTCDRRATETTIREHLMGAHGCYVKADVRRLNARIRRSRERADRARTPRDRVSERIQARLAGMGMGADERQEGRSA